jgi:deoxyribose-phosphate aldolase
MPTRTIRDVAALLDHAVLKPNFTAADLAAHAAMCVARGVGCLCVRPADVAAAVGHVAGSPVVVASVIGFPHGSHRPETKALESRLAIADGAKELDMVIALGPLLSGDESRVREDIGGVVAAARPYGVLVKVIFETCYLTPAQIVTACRLAEEAGANFVKTSTGFGTAGATPEAVRLMLDTVGGRLGVKASGGIRTWDDAVMYLDMGCTRLGVGDAAAILDGSTAAGGY